MNLRATTGGGPWTAALTSSNGQEQLRMYRVKQRRSADSVYTSTAAAVWFKYLQFDQNANSWHILNRIWIRKYKSNSRNRCMLWAKKQCRTLLAPPNSWVLPQLLNKKLLRRASSWQLVIGGNNRWISCGAGWKVVTLRQGNPGKRYSPWGELYKMLN